MIRRIRDLLYDQGFTISGARNKLHEIVQIEGDKRRNGEVMLDGIDVVDHIDLQSNGFADSADFEESICGGDGSSDDGDSDGNGHVHLNGTDLPNSGAQQRLQLIRRELFEIRELLTAAY